MSLPAYMEDNRADAEALLRHLQEFRPADWASDATLEDLAREMEADAALLRESDPGYSWTAEAALLNALDNHDVGRDWCESCGEPA